MIVPDILESIAQNALLKERKPMKTFMRLSLMIAMIREEFISLISFLSIAGLAYSADGYGADRIYARGAKQKAEKIFPIDLPCSGNDI